MKRELTLVAVSGHEPSPDALYLVRAGLSAAEHGRLGRLHRHRAQGRLHALQILPHTYIQDIHVIENIGRGRKRVRMRVGWHLCASGESAPGAHSAHQDVDGAVRLEPQLIHTYTLYDKICSGGPVDLTCALWGYQCC